MTEVQVYFAAQFVAAGVENAALLWLNQPDRTVERYVEWTLPLLPSWITHS
jgi:hypothetical protein